MSAGAPSESTNDIPEIFRVANLLCERQFIPDYVAIYQATQNPDAPRVTSEDAVWADPAPLFIRSANAS